MQTEPPATITKKVSSRATCQLTSIRAPRPLPGVASGDWMARVRSITEIAVGTLLATPWPNIPFDAGRGDPSNELARR